MIKLTSHGGGEFYFNPERINVIAPSGENGLAYIEYDQDRYVVIASPEEVVRKIMEYKIRTIQYGQYLQDALMGGDWGKTKESMNALFQLAGLEDNQDG